MTSDNNPFHRAIRILGLFAPSLIVIIVLAFFFLPDRGSRVAIPKKTLPNVIFIICETLRPDHLGVYGYARDTAPNLDRLAQTSFLFTQSISQAPCTRPSVWNMMTSRYQAEVPVLDETFTLAEYLSAMRYKTAAFIAQHVLVKQYSNLNQGFDWYDDAQELDHHRMTLRKATSVTDAAIAWLQVNKQKRFFTWLMYFDPHDPYDPPDQAKGHFVKSEDYSRDRRKEKIHFVTEESRNITPAHRRFLIDAYDEEIRYTDQELGRFLDYLRESGLFDDSLIIFTSDHGEELGEDNRWDHCQLLSQEEIWVPLLIKLPGQKSGKRIGTPVQTIDIYPTLVEYFHGADLPSFYDELEGRSFLSWLGDTEAPGEERYAVSFWRRQASVFFKGHKLWRHGEDETLVPLDVPPSMAKEGLTADTVRQVLRQKLDEVVDKYIRKKAYYKKTMEKLRSIGYVQ